MLTSLALIFLVGLLLSSIFQKLKIPGLLGMLATGLVLGPYALNLLDSSLLGISADPVSYTHLDVYKRQDSVFSASLVR